MSHANPMESTTRQSGEAIEQTGAREGRARVIALPTGAQEGEPLTPEKLRTFPGCEGYSDDEAQEVVQTLKTLAAQFLQRRPEVGTTIDNQCVIKKIEQKTPLKRAA